MLIETTIASPHTASRGATRGWLEEFLREPSLPRALALWLSKRLPPGTTVDKARAAQMLGRDIAWLDAALNDQLNAILHHPRFQRIEGSWRGLHYLVSQLGEAEGIKIRVLNLSWRELARDLEHAIEFDQSQLFHKVYSQEFGTAGGEPFSVLLGDYEVRPRPCQEHPVDDVRVLKAVSQVAAAAFAPFVGSVHPSMFGVDDFSTLEQPLNLPRIFDQLDYLNWRAFRQMEDARFVGLTMPRMLMRLPYEDDNSRIDGFRFQEEVAGTDRRKYLWGSAVYAFGAVLIRSFAASGWLADIRGVRRGTQGGGLVSGLAVHSFSTDKRGVAVKSSTDVVITDAQEADFSRLGFIPLCRCKDTDCSAFYTCQSVQTPQQYTEAEATSNARISAMLQYMLCVSRFAHYVKSVARDKIGLFQDAEECEDFLYRWLQNYVTPDSEASPEVKARLPLREAKVLVREHPEKPGSYLCIVHLWPHFELDELCAAVKVTTELTPEQPV